MKTHRIAAIPGDGIGVPVTDAALAVASASRARLEVTRFDWSCETYVATGAMMPADGIDTLRGFDAIFLGAVGWPARVPDSVSLHGLLLPIRKAFAQYANVRPHRLLPGVEGPLRLRLRHPLRAREHRGRVFRRRRPGACRHPRRGGDRDRDLPRAGVERILRFGFEQARRRRASSPR